METYKQYEIRRVKDGQVETLLDDVVREYPLTIYINDVEFVTLLCTPSHMEELVLGYLKTSYLIETYEDIQSLILDEDKGLCYVDLLEDIVENQDLRRRYVTAGCASSAVFYDTMDAIKLKARGNYQKINNSEIFNVVNILHKEAHLYQRTGGSHVVGLFNSSSDYLILEDIGRHNGVDKLIGHMVKGNFVADQPILAVSGRISSEILLKCAKASIACVVSKGAPTDKTLDLARKLKILVVGFVRGNRLNIYT